MTEQHRAFRQLQHVATLSRRQTRTLGERLDKALGYARLVTSARVGGIERQSPSAEQEGIGAPSGDLSQLYAPGVEDPHSEFKYRATVLVELLEREVDAHRSSPIFGDATQETKEERDRRLLDFHKRGLPPEVIDLLDPAQGGVKAIRLSLKRLADQD